MKTLIMKTTHKGIQYRDIVNAVKELEKKGFNATELTGISRWSEGIPEESPKPLKEPSKFGKNFNPSKRYQVIIGIKNFGTQNAHVIPLNEFDCEDWVCPRCNQCMQDTILYKNKKVFCEHCGLELWKEMQYPQFP